VARFDPSPAKVARQMWTAAALAIAVGVLVAAIAPVNLALAFPLIALWVLSPAIAYVTGRPISHERQPLGPAERAAFRRIARKTWRFFEELLVPGDHWLVPDNYQEDRDELVAPS